jgi:hypothetical protein
MPAISSPTSRVHSPAFDPLLELPAQGTASQTGSISVPRAISRLWDALKNIGRQPVMVAAIPVNHTGVECIGNDSVIKVSKFKAVAQGQPSLQKEVQIHAHMVAITTSVDGQEARHYAVGQSPPEKSCRDFVLQGVQSGRGLFQFVSRKAHHDLEDASVEPMSAMLAKLLKSAKENGADGLVLDERYKLTGIAEQKNGKDATRFDLTITDGRLGEPVTIPLMQAGLKFTGKLLRAEQIERAAKLLDQCSESKPLLADRPPLILSAAGHGRNAVLMTYREIVRQIDEKLVTDKASLETALHAVISAGRKIRSPYFVHSERQLEQLYLALEKKLQPKAASPVGTNEGATRRRLQHDTTQLSQKVVADQPTSPVVEAELVSIHRKIALYLPGAHVRAENILNIRTESNKTNLITKFFERISKKINTVDGNQATWLGSSTNDHLIVLGLRSMSLIGKSIEANALFNVLVNNIGSDNRDKRIHAFRAALLEPVLLSKPQATYDSYFFPCKTLPVSTIEKMGPNKAALFEKQNALYLEHRHTSKMDVPLKAIFSKEAKVASYRQRGHLSATLGQLHPCTVSSKEALYFASQVEPEQSVYDVHVDFANALLGGTWTHDGSFAQEEVAFIENIGLGAVAICAQEKAKWLKDFTKDSLPSGSPSYGKDFLTRRSDKTPSPILIEGAERVAHFVSYGSTAAALDKARLTGDQNYKKTDACLPTNWLAIAAPNFRGKVKGSSWQGESGDQIREAFEDIFSTAHAGFTMAKTTAGESRTLRINTGQLGCGVFGNSLAISTAAQILAAKIVGVNDLVFHHYSGKDKGLPEKIEAIVSEKLEAMDATSGTVQGAIDSILKSKRFRKLI